jgi:hypothetical protein
MRAYVSGTALYRFIPASVAKRPLQTIDCSGRLTTVTLPILTRSRPLAIKRMVAKDPLEQPSCRGPGVNRIRTFTLLRAIETRSAEDNIALKIKGSLSVWPHALVFRDCKSLVVVGQRIKCTWRTIVGTPCNVLGIAVQVLGVPPHRRNDIGVQGVSSRSTSRRPTPKWRRKVVANELVVE